MVDLTLLVQAGSHRGTTDEVAYGGMCSVQAYKSYIVFQHFSSKIGVQSANRSGHSHSLNIASVWHMLFLVQLVVYVYTPCSL
jgi:hypothetical protein